MKNLGQLEVKNVFIRGTERIQGVSKTKGTEYDFTVLRFDDETGAGYEIRLEDDVDANRFTVRREGDLIVNVYCAKTAYLKAVDFKEYKSK